MAGAAAGEVGAIGGLLEREQETSEIAAALRSVRAGDGQLLVVEGHAGLGKSALVAEAIEWARNEGMDVLVGRGTELERDFSFGVCLQLFEPRLAGEDRGGREQLFSGAAGLSLPLFRDGPPSELGAEEDRVFALVHGLFWLCANLAERTPLLLVVDDAHWADRSSLRLLHYVGERLAELPVALLATMRPAEPDAPRDLLGALVAQRHSRVLRLRALSESAAATLVRRRWPAAEDAFADACARVSGGNPFYLRELVHALDADGVEATAASVAQVARFAPDSVLRAVLVRLARFPAAAVALARALAVLGEAPLRHIATVAGLDAAQAARAGDALAAAEILRSGDAISYVHPLLRSTVYADTPAGERALLHARAARTVADDLAPALAASHLLLTSASGDPWVVDMLRQAAREALAAGGAESAARYLRRALAEPPEPDDRARVLVELAEAEATAGAAAEDAAGHLEQALGLMRDPRERAETLLRLGWLLHKAGRLAEAAATFLRGLDELSGADDALMIQLEVGYLGVAWWYDSARASDVRERRAGLLARRGSIPREMERALLAQETIHELFAGESHERVIERATQLLDGRALIAEETSDSLNVWIAIGSLSFADELDLAEQAIESALEDARRRGAFLNAAMGYYARAWPRYWRGRLVESAADAEIAVEASSGSWNMYLPVAKYWLALARIELDDVDGAAAALELPEEERWKDTLMYGALLIARGRVALARARPHTALSELLDAGHVLAGTFFFDNPSALPWRADAALAAAQLGDAARARQLVGEELRLTRRFGAPRSIGVSLRAAGLIEGGERGAELLREAVAVLEASPAKLELARALIDLGATLRRAGKRGASREPLRRGLAMVEHFGAFRLERQARAELAAAGAHLRQRTLSGRDSLTPSELRVAEMAAAGMTNRTIAQSLFVTVNAVKWHLRHAYGKLDITSRDQLRDALEPRVGDGSSRG